MKIMLRAPFDVCSGYGGDGVDLALALEAAGHDVVPYPTSCGPGLPPAMARLLEKPIGQAFDVALMFAPPFDLRPSCFPRGVRSVGYTMWERTPLLPADFNDRKWEEESARRFSAQHPLSHLDALAVTCAMNVEAFRPVAGETPISVAPCGVNGERFPVLERDPVGSRPMRFLMVGALGPRKNPFATLEAWRLVCERYADFDAELLLHSTVPGLHPGVAETYGRNITVRTRMLPPDGLLGMYRDHDVMLCPSRGEGNNKPPMEFMATGGHVIASDWSGHENWLSPVTCAVPVRGQVGPSPLAYGTDDFAVNVLHLADCIYDAWRYPHATRNSGEESAHLIRERCSWEQTVAGLEPLLRGEEGA